uniref:Uncharacterized protein n=1 Tax=Plectus sambesii TaxID=2011161 RepID=A0A914UHC2_9BILA
MCAHERCGALVGVDDSEDGERTRQQQLSVAARAREATAVAPAYHRAAPRAKTVARVDDCSWLGIRRAPQFGCNACGQLAHRSGAVRASALVQWTRRSASKRHVIERKRLCLFVDRVYRSDGIHRDKKPPVGQYGPRVRPRPRRQQPSWTVCRSIDRALTNDIVPVRG